MEAEVSGLRPGRFGTGNGAGSWRGAFCSTVAAITSAVEHSELSATRVWKVDMGTLYDGFNMEDGGGLDRRVGYMHILHCAVWEVNGDVGVYVHCYMHCAAFVGAF